MDDVPLVRLLSMTVTLALDELHQELAAEGHSSLRPAHGYALNAILNGVATASDMAPRLGMTKQGVAKLLTHLEAEGYVRQQEDGDVDGRRKPFVLTERGREAIELSVAAQARIEERWAELAGERRMATARRCLAMVLDASLDEDGEPPAARPAW